MATRATLRIVTEAPDRLECTKEGLRALLRERDELLARLADVNRRMGLEGREYADLLGEKLLPTVERLRRDLGVGNGPR